jgi:hypothetical protein
VNTKANAPPKTLKAGGRQLWRNVVNGWDVAQEQYCLLENACKCQDRIDRLSAIVEKEGPVQRNRFGVAVAHPAALLLRSEVSNFSQLYRLLQLEAPRGGGDGPGRPAGWAPED